MASVGTRPQVDAPVAVEVHRVPARAARHELRDADRAGIRALHRKDVEAVVARKQQVLLELAAEEARARRIVEGERGEGVDHAEATGVAAVVGLDADDGDHEFRRHAEIALGAPQAVRLARQKASPAAMRFSFTNWLRKSVQEGFSGGWIDCSTGSTRCTPAKVPRSSSGEEAVPRHHVVDEGPAPRARAS